MSRRILALIIALALAVLAAFFVFRYAQQADSRAMADLTPEHVLVVTATVPEGTAAEALDDYVELEERPTATIANDAVQSLDTVAGLVTDAALYPGEQVLSTRFISPDAETSVDIPEGYHEVTISLSTPRVIGGHLKAGDTVGVFASSDEETTVLLHKVLVTNVQGGAVISQAEDGTESVQPAGESLMVTLAVEPSDAQRVVNAAEFYGVWLSLEPLDAAEGLTAVTREDLFG